MTFPVLVAAVLDSFITESGAARSRELRPARDSVLTSFYCLDLSGAEASGALVRVSRAGNTPRTILEGFTEAKGNSGPE